MLKYLWENGWWAITGILVIGKLLGLVKAPWPVVLLPAIVYWAFVIWCMQGVLATL